MMHINCPRCQALNSSRQGRCEACGASLEWANWKSRAPQMSKKATGVACLIGGLAVGFLGSHFSRPPAQPGPSVPPPSPPPVVASSNAPQVDVVFVIDATGSMADEIDVVKAQVQQMMMKVQSGQPRPFVRFGLVSFRDRGDTYVTKAQPLTADIQSIQAAVNELQADGGGDTPESVNEALHVGVQEMNWNLDQKTRRLIFLIGDAAPHMDYANDYDYRNELKVARSRGIKVHAWGCSGIADSGEPEFREIASLGGGDFQFLTYHQAVVKEDGSESEVIFQGKKSYEVRRGYDWKVGADKVEASARTELRSVEAPSAGGSASYGRFAKTTSAPMENNLDRVLTEQVMDEAKAAGTKY